METNFPVGYVGYYDPVIKRFTVFVNKFQFINNTVLHVLRKSQNAEKESRESIGWIVRTAWNLIMNFTPE